jgi:hypothetical protein
MAPTPDVSDDWEGLVDDFWELYDAIRNDILTLETENPGDFRFAAGFIAEVRNAIDYFAISFKDKNEEILRTAIKSLNEDGDDVLEFILSEKIKQVYNCIQAVSKILKRLIFPRDVRDYLLGSIKLMTKHLEDGRNLKPVGYSKSAPEFIKGIDLGRKVLSEYEQSKIAGMTKGERRYDWIATFLIGVVVGLVGGILAEILLKFINLK